MRIIGVDIHRVFAEAVALEGASLRRPGRIGMTRDHLAAFATTLSKNDHCDRGGGAGRRVPAHTLLPLDDCLYALQAPSRT